MWSAHVILACAFIACACAQVSLSPLHIERIKLNPRLKFSKQARQPRDVTWDKRNEHDIAIGTIGGDGKDVYGGDILHYNHGLMKRETSNPRVFVGDGDCTHLIEIQDIMLTKLLMPYWR